MNDRPCWLKDDTLIGEVGLLPNIYYLPCVSEFIL